MTALQGQASAATSDDTGGRRPELMTLLILGGLAFLSSVGLAIAYRGGLRVSTGDPVAYLSMARSLAAGHGASVPFGDLYSASPMNTGGPVSHWPIGYPLLLSLDTHSLLAWARVLAVVIYGLNVFLFGLLALRIGVARLGAIALAIIFAGLSLEIHGTVQSEPLFFLLVLLGLHAFVSFRKRPSAVSVLLVAVAFGLSTVTRFLGEAFVIGGALAILVFLKEQRFPRRVRDALLLIFVGNIPFLIWLSSVHNSPETLGLHLLSFYDTKTTLSTFAGFIIPGTQSANAHIFIATVIIIVCVGILAAVGTRASLSPVRNDSVDWPMLLFAVVYLLFLFFSRSVVDPLIQLNDRMLFLPFVLILLWCAQNWPRLVSWSGVPRHSWLPVLATILVGLLVVSAIWRADQVARYAQSGSIATPSPTNLVLKKVMAGVPSNWIIYSNEPDAVYFLTGRTVYLLPNTLSASTLKANHDFGSEMSSIERRLCGKHGIVVFSLSEDSLEPSLPQVQHNLKIASRYSVPGWKLLNLDSAPTC